MILRRHDLLLVSPYAWEKVKVAFPHFAQQPLVGDWVALGWPVMVRRRMENEARTSVPAALPLPPMHGKLRLAFTFASADGLRAVPPLSLRVAAKSAPPRWSAAIYSLIDLSRELRVEVHVFGSLLWQHVTRLPYVTHTSDLDLRWQVPNAETANFVIERLTELDRKSAVKIDGELEMPDGAGVNWRELRQLREGKTEHVLAKTLDRVDLRTKEILFPENCRAAFGTGLVAP